MIQRSNPFHQHLAILAPCDSGTLLFWALAPATITTVCFDWDGTLCDSGPASLRAFRKSLAEFGVTFTDAEYKAVYSPRWYRMYEALKLPNPCWRQADQRWLHHYGREEPDLISGAPAVLESLRRRGIRLGIVTNGTRKRVDRELERLRLQTMFDAVICCEDVIEKKPHPEGLDKALTLLNCPPAAACYVGDTPEDVHMGKNAGVFSVGILSQYVDDRRLRESEPDVLLNAIEELPTVFG
jgi:HAD superfamily hydrolase (TIGR01509 family)